MAGDAKKLQPIIIKRVKKGGHVAHGGAWKIAYADFVTAMMAFFLLMWLLGSTSEGDKKGISDYFQKKAEVAKRDAKMLAELSAKIAAAISNNPKMAEFASQIRLEITPDGLQIQIVDDQKRPMFDSGSAALKPYMRDILREIGTALLGVENKISLDGHTDRSAYGNAGKGYSNWELSADRANASRRELANAGMPEDKLARVVGMASSLLLDTADPLSPTNRRISILVMTKDAEERLLGGQRVAVDGTGEVETAQAPVVTPPAH
jgi:chemotaxis protein MotB